MKTPIIYTSLTEILEHGETLLQGISCTLFQTRIEQAHYSTIGAHYRHVLDHCKTLVDGAHQGGAVLDYDTRIRDPRLETDRLFALATTTAYRNLVGEWSKDEDYLKRPILARCKTSYSAIEGTECVSTWEREIMFVISHSIHHYAIIGLLCKIQGTPVPEGFGVAPSTLQYQGK